MICCSCIYFSALRVMQAGFEHISGNCWITYLQFTKLLALQEDNFKLDFIITHTDCIK
jgi:hypothetical protein